MKYEKGKHLKNEMRPRLTEIPQNEPNAKEMSDSALGYLNKRTDMFAMLGLAIGQNGEVEDKKAASKFFLLRQDDDGTFRRMSLEEAGITPKSREFWQEAQRGNLFVFAAGSPNPSQVQLDFDGRDKRPLPAFSKPVDPAAVTAGGRVEKPNFFKRLLNRINKNWFKAECEPWNKQEASAAKLREDLSKETAERQKNAEQEIREVENIEAAQAAAAKRAKCEEMVKEAQKRLERTRIGTRNSEAVFEPTPKIYETEETLKRFPGRTTKESYYYDILKLDGEHPKYGYMRADHFENLTQFDADKLDLDSIKLGQSGRTVSKSEFCSLALFACMDNEIEKNIEKNRNNKLEDYDPTVRSVLLNEVGMSEQQVDEILSYNGYGMYTSDTFMTLLRDMSGSYIKEGINVARQNTVDALNAYKNGNLEPLAKLIAVGVNKEAGDIARETENFGEEFAGMCNSSRNMINVLKADPKLKEAALKAGMDEKNFRVVDGVGKLCKLDEKACEANLKLAKAERDGVTLSAEEKMDCIKSIVTSQLAFQIMTTENKNARVPQADELFEKLAGPPMRPGATREEVIAERPKGKLYFSTCVSLTGLWMPAALRRKPVSIMSLNSATGMENLEKTAAEIIKQDKLAELSPGELVEKLRMNDAKYGAYGMYGERGLEFMEKQGMLKPEVNKIIQEELRLGITEKTASAAEPDALKRQAELAQNEPRKEAAQAAGA